MKSFTNIDKSVFRKGEYIGYCSKGALRICRCEGGWRTYAQGSKSGEYIPLSARTLEEMSEKLNQI